MRRRVALLLSACLLVALGLAANAHAATDMFLELEGIKGESQDEQHKDAIDVHSWSWGASRGSGDKKSASPSEPVSIQNLEFTHSIDSASPKLLERLLTGDSIASGKLTLRRSGENPVEYLELCMKGIDVTSFSTGGSGEEDRITESVTLHFNQFRYEYTPQNEEGQPVASIFTSWDAVKSELVNLNC